MLCPTAEMNNKANMVEIIILFTGVFQSAIAVLHQQLWAGSQQTAFCFRDPTAGGLSPSLELSHCWSPSTTSTTPDNVDQSATDIDLLSVEAVDIEETPPEPEEVEEAVDVLDVTEEIQVALKAGSNLTIPAGLHSALESVVKRLPTAELERMVQDQLQQVINRNKYTTWLCKQLDETDSLLIKYQQKMDVLQKHVNDLSHVVDNYTSRAEGKGKPPIKLARNVGLQVRMKPVPQVCPRQTTPEMGLISSDTPSGSAVSEMNRPTGETSATESEEEANSKSKTNETQTTKSPDLARPHRLEIDLTLSDDEGTDAQPIRSPNSATKSGNVDTSPEKPISCSSVVVPTTSSASVSLPPTTTKVMTIIHDVMSLASLDERAPQQQQQDPIFNGKNSSSTSAPSEPAPSLVASNHRSPLVGLLSDAGSVVPSAERVKVGVSSAPSVNSTGIFLSSQSRSSSESVHSTGFIPSSFPGSIPHHRPVPFVRSIASTEFVPPARTFPPPELLSASRSLPPFASSGPRFPTTTSIATPVCGQNSTHYSCHPDRKRRLPCTITNYDASTIASVEKYHKLIKETWYDPRLLQEAPVRAPQPVLNNQDYRPMLRPELMPNDPMNSQKTVAVVPPVMMSPPAQIDRWLIPKHNRQADAERRMEPIGMYHKWKLPLLAGAVLTRPSVKQPLMFKAQQPPHFSSPTIRIGSTPSNPSPTNYGDSMPISLVQRDNNMYQNMVHMNRPPPPPNQSFLNPPMPIPFRAMPIQPELPRSSFEVPSSRPTLLPEKPAANHQSVIVAPSSHGNSLRGNLTHLHPPPAVHTVPSPAHGNPAPPTYGNLPQPKSSKTDRLPGLISITDKSVPFILKNPSLPTNPHPLDLERFLHFKPVLKLKRTDESGVRVKWTVPNLSPNQVNDILSYELYARQDVGPSEQWLRMTSMQALPLPMGCNLSKFALGYRYFFRIRAIFRCVGETREGPYSEALSMVFD